MSASDPNTTVFMTDSPAQVKNKINKHAFSGGGGNVRPPFTSSRPLSLRLDARARSDPKADPFSPPPSCTLPPQGSAEDQRRLGGNPDVDISFQYLRFFEEDDALLDRLDGEYRRGELLSGELKKRCIDKLQTFVAEFQEVRCALLSLSLSLSRRLRADSPSPAADPHPLPLLPRLLPARSAVRP